MNTSVRTGEGLDLCWGVGSFFFKKQNKTVVQFTSLEMNVQGKFWQSCVCNLYSYQETKLSCYARNTGLIPPPAKPPADAGEP